MTPGGATGPTTPGVAVRWLARSPRRAFLAIFLLSMGLRGSFLALVPSEYFLPDAGWEVGAVAQSLATTGTFANPYSVPTGPTAHTPPLYPALLGLIYRAFGISLMAGYVSWMLAMTSASALYGLLPWLAERFGIPREAGLMGGILGALLPTWPAQVETLSAIALSVLLVSFLRRWTDGKTVTATGALRLGMVAGVSFHLSPSLLPVVLACAAFDGWWRHGRRRWRSPLLLIAGMVVVCLPWTWRNYMVFDDLFFIRDNLGLELRLANHEGATLERTTQRHPRVSVEEGRRVQELGERAYMREARREAVEWIRSDPATFLWLTAGRVVYFWLGPLERPLAALPTIVTTILAAVGAVRLLPRLGIPQRFALAVPLATYPVVYYFVNYLPRYRVTVDWILLLCAGAALWHPVHGLRDDPP